MSHLAEENAALVLIGCAGRSIFSKGEQRKG